MATIPASHPKKRTSAAQTALRSVRELCRENQELKVEIARLSRNLAASTATVKELGRKLKQATKRNQ